MLFSWIMKELSTGNIRENGEIIQRKEGRFHGKR